VSVWEKNREILQSHYPGLFEELNSGSDNLAPEDMAIETAPSGDPSLGIKGVHVHSPRDPAREGQRLAESIKDGKGAVVVLGFGLGYAARSAAALCTGRPIIIVEKYKNLILKAFELGDFSDFLLKNKIIFVVGGSGAGITSALSIADEITGKEEKAEASVIRNRALVDLDKDWYGAVEDKLRTWKMRDDVNAATLKRFGKRWVRNLSQNMSAIRDVPGISRLAGLAAAGDKPLPVFLAAAGPSLDKTAPLLHDIYKRCIVVAVDTNLRFFVNNGVKPDFVLVVDPQFWNSRHLDRCVCEKTALVAESAVFPPVMRLPFDKTFLCGSLFPLGTFIESKTDPKGKLGAGGSVATTAWDFARSLGGLASEKHDIWIAGLDLAFPGYKTHFRGARFEDRAACETNRFKPVETWVVRALRDGIPFKAKSSTGGQVLTDRRLSLYAAWFENQFKNNAGVKNYALFQEGLAIAGLQAAETKDLLALPERRDEIDKRLNAAFSEIENSFNGSEEARKRGEKYAEIVSVLKRGLKSIKNAAEEGETLARNALKREQNQSQKDKLLKELDSVTKRIAESEVKEVAGFLFQELDADDKGAKADGAKADDTAAKTDPFKEYLNSSIKLFSSLAESAAFNLENMESL
jgi:hypothetical protein